MDRRTFLAATGSLSLVPILTGRAAEPDAANPLDAAEGSFTAGSGPGPVFAGSPVVSGPAPDSLTILQPLQRHATGYLEYKVDDEPWLRVDAAAAGLLPLEQYALKFRLPPLPAGRAVSYRIRAHTVGWVRVVGRIARKD